ncbi:DUF420 domain-containing protein [Alkalihalobacillus trypoxylicola]|uniref:DUF420 domain-containing protein n=1 Tax=Alkalihalobacillus trypoxylicola TaxID=519424 RepID=A0A161QBB5_9BACI|nr:DUF420 domain-containing protein [Alkalihalobacillus trypoxylicola]KYG35207.1 hypothetical protein AZF04_02385 [Alkalihalobacillus trypoxylicola]
MSQKDYVQTNEPVKKRNYKPLIFIVTVIINGLVLILSRMPAYEGFDLFDVKILPLMNAIFNTFTFFFLLTALIFILKKNVTWHRRFIYAAFVTTSLFLITYVAHHFLSTSTSYGGDGFLAGFYYFILITHIVLAAVIVPLALMSVTRAWNMEIDRHRKIARWTMPLWLYVSLTGVLVYILISPYY